MDLTARFFSGGFWQPVHLMRPRQRPERARYRDEAQTILQAPDVWEIICSTVSLINESSYTKHYISMRPFSLAFPYV
eukprot:998790-Amphidinium_carterae.1